MHARTLPLRVEPYPGEAIDSWLDFIAHRSNVTWGELRTALGGVVPAGPNPDRWIGHLNQEQATAISLASGIDPSCLRAMTLEDYPSAAVGFDPISANPAASYPWRHIRASRFCPRCLADNGGRWKLSWRMVWFFACLEHCCLLAHECPKCGAAQRARPAVNSVPQPGRCAESVSPTRSSNPQRCCADLSKAPVLSLETGSPIPPLQASIADLIINEQGAFGIYKQFPTPIEQILVDLRVLGERILLLPKQAPLARYVPEKLLEAYFCLSEPTRTIGGRMPSRAVPAAVTAAGLSAAMAVVGQCDSESAGEELRSIWPQGRLATLGQSIDLIGKRKAETSAALRAVYLHALAPALGVPDQLRYRCGSKLPARPTRSMPLVRRMAATIPTLLWPQLTLRLAEPSGPPKVLRAALSVGLLVTGNDITTDEAMAMLKCPIKNSTVIASLRNQYESTDWPSVRDALYRTADYLRVYGSPIDYQRRRDLDVRDILPESSWLMICEDTNSRSEGLEAVRLFLVERLNAVSPASRNPRLTAAAARISIRLTPDLHDALMDYAVQFLAEHGIADEPPQWFPPTELLTGLALPRTGTESVDVIELHKVVNMLRRRRIRIGAAVERLGLPLDVFRQACEDYPAPREPRRRPARVVTPEGPSPAYQQARERITPERMKQLYLTDGLSLKAISSMFATSSYTVARLARDYGVPITRTRAVSRSIDPGWLREQYVNKGRTIKDLSEEMGVAPATVRRVLEAQHIPLRWFTTRPAGQFPAGSGVPKLLLPALVTRAGWQRLQRFARAAAYTSLAEAGRELAMFGSSLSLQISRIERDLERPLLVRATRQKPMQLTPLGKRVVGAVQQWESAGGPQLTL